MIRPVNATTPACYGLTCPHHHDCLRYAAVEHTSPEQTIATCSDDRRTWPLLSLPEETPADLVQPA